MRPSVLPVIAAVVLMGVDLSPATLRAFDHYVSLTEQRITAERDGKAPLFWLERQSERVRAKTWERLRRGETVVELVETRENGRTVAIPNGRVHHWVATALLPGVPADRVVGLVRDYAAYPKVFAPLMSRASAIARTESRDVVALRTSVKKLINVVMDGDYVMEYRRLAPGRFATTTVATNLHQVINEGQADERRQPTDQTQGYLWRYRMYCAVEERPEGTLDQCESLTLTRTVPGLVSWIVGGTVAGIPRDSLALMVSAARKTLVK